jgi:hypothetical protein
MRTNLQADSAEQMWSVSMQLTGAGIVSGVQEYLSIRRSFHQKESRVKAHVWVAWVRPCGRGAKHLEQRRPDGPTALGQQRGQGSAVIANDGASFVIYAAKR